MRFYKRAILFLALWLFYFSGTVVCAAPAFPKKTKCIAVAPFVNLSSMEEASYVVESALFSALVGGFKDCFIVSSSELSLILGNIDISNESGVGKLIKSLAPMGIGYVLIGKINRYKYVEFELQARPDLSSADMQSSLSINMELLEVPTGRRAAVVKFDKDSVSSLVRDFNSLGELVVEAAGVAAHKIRTAVSVGRPVVMCRPSLVLSELDKRTGRLAGKGIYINPNGEIVLPQKIHFVPATPFPTPSTRDILRKLGRFLGARDLKESRINIIVSRNKWDARRLSLWWQRLLLVKKEMNSGASRVLPVSINISSPVKGVTSDEVRIVLKNK